MDSRRTRAVARRRSEKTTGRRALLAGAAAALAAGSLAGCLDVADRAGRSDGGGGTPTDVAPEETAAGTDGTSASSDRLRAAPALTVGDHDPVLSTADEAVVAHEPLYEAVAEAVRESGVVYRALSAEEAEAFRSITADVERYAGGNPPGYYVDHEGDTVSVSL